MSKTKHQLQKLIREELASIIDEGAVPAVVPDPCKLGAYALGKDEYHQRRGAAASRHCPGGKSLDRLERNPTMPPHKTRFRLNIKNKKKEKTAHPSTYREAPMQEEVEAIIKEEYKKLLYEDEARQERRGLEYDIKKDPPVDYTQPRGSSYEASYGAEAPPDYSGPAGVTGIGGMSTTPQAQKTATPQLLDHAILKNLIKVAQDPGNVYYHEARSALSAYGSPQDWLGASDESWVGAGLKKGITPPGLTQKDLDRFTEYYWQQPTVGPLRSEDTWLSEPQYQGPGEEWEDWGDPWRLRTLEEHQNRIVQEEYNKLLEEHAKDYIWGVKAPYNRTANQYELSVLKKDLIG